uniref:Reverse transcriptase domain-containing protein n=1 Tax=Tanacetum cinerariifolium TaxID=118510 RepID=A0A699IIY6_TANCI|nr:hypothetical protein [Tanacetum cinerariifolium]
MDQYLEGVNIVDDTNNIKMVPVKDITVSWSRRQYEISNEVRILSIQRRGVQDLFTVIAHADALIDFAKRREPSTPKDQRVNHEKGWVEKNVRAKVDNAQKPSTEKRCTSQSSRLAQENDGKTCMVSMERDFKCAARPFWPCNSKNGTTRVSLAFSGDKARDVWESSKVEVPKEIERVLDELKYVMTKMLPSMREVDHAIKL